ncbi:MAG: hypothetical protein KBD15_03230 [Candidatus Magasanikbacteria bacterium]|nr:hypothetical protein [Candidatus Magasanikbacteria bacterium]
MSPTNLPPILPTSASSSPSRPSVSGGWGHAQDLSVSQLQQKKDRDAARTSIGRVIQQDGDMTPSTSISHPAGVGATAQTSIFSAPKDTVALGATQGEQDASDDRRYNYMQRLIRAKRAQMRATLQSPDEASPTQHTPTLEVKTGKALKRTGLGGLHKRLGKMYKENKTRFKNLSSGDKKLFEDMVASRAKKKSVGSDFRYTERRDMKHTIEQSRKKGIISKSDAEDFKGLIDTLKKPPSN